MAILLGHIFEAEFFRPQHVAHLDMLMLSYVLLSGYVGQISLAQPSLAGVAGFAIPA